MLIFLRYHWLQESGEENLQEKVQEGGKVNLTEKVQEGGEENLTEKVQEGGEENLTEKVLQASVELTIFLPDFLLNLITFDIFNSCVDFSFPHVLGE
jgi:hypothetical protein